MRHERYLIVFDHSAGDTPYECEVCHKRFIDLGSKKKHMTVHTGIKAYQCTICNRAFSRSQSLKDHTRVHTGMYSL